MNANGQDRPLAFAIQIDSLAIQEQRFIPLSAPGVEPNGWDGLDGFVANNIVYVNTSFQGIQPGKHTLRVSPVNNGDIQSGVSLSIVARSG